MAGIAYVPTTPPPPWLPHIRHHNLPPSVNAKCNASMQSIASMQMDLYWMSSDASLLYDLHCIHMAMPVGRDIACKYLSIGKPDKGSRSLQSSCSIASIFSGKRNSIHWFHSSYLGKTLQKPPHPPTA